MNVHRKLHSVNCFSLLNPFVAKKKEGKNFVKKTFNCPSSFLLLNKTLIIISYRIQIH